MPARKKDSNPLESVVDAVKKAVGGGARKTKRATKKVTGKKTTGRKSTAKKRR